VAPLKESLLLQVRLVLAVAITAASAAGADTGCDPLFTRAFHECLRLVDSLQPDKAGRARVYAADGAEFTAAQAEWMRGQLREIATACARGNQAQAARRLGAVQELIRGHVHAS